MGLAALDLHHWIEPDERFVSDLHEKERLLHECHQDVFADLPTAAAGSAEVLDLLAEYLPARFPMLYQRAGHWLQNVPTGCRWNLAESTLHPLDLAGRLVQEDLCLMQQAEGLQRITWWVARSASPRAGALQKSWGNPWEPFTLQCLATRST